MKKLEIKKTKTTFISCILGGFSITKFLHLFYKQKFPGKEICSWKKYVPTPANSALDMLLIEDFNKKWYELYFVCENWHLCRAVGAKGRVGQSSIPPRFWLEYQERYKMSTWTSFVKIWTVNNCEFNANFLTFGFIPLAFCSRNY